MTLKDTKYMKRTFTKYPSNYIQASKKSVWYLVDDLVNYTSLCNPDTGARYTFNSKEEAQAFIDKNNIDAIPHHHFERSVWNPNYRGSYY